MNTKFYGLLIKSILVLLLCTLAGSLHAQSKDIHISGFVSQGYLFSTENNYPVANSTKGSSEFNEVAVTVYTLPSDRLRLGIQLLGRDMCYTFIIDRLVTNY